MWVVIILSGATGPVWPFPSDVIREYLAAVCDTENYSAPYDVARLLQSRRNAPHILISRVTVAEEFYFPSDRWNSFKTGP